MVLTKPNKDRLVPQQLHLNHAVTSSLKKNIDKLDQIAERKLKFH